MSQDKKKIKLTVTQLSELRNHSVVVADTGDIDSIKEYKPTDATTNPSLILQSASDEKYNSLVKEAAKYASEKESDLKESLALAIDKVCVNFGVEILKILPENGLVSTEVDARLSFDTEKSVARAKRIIKMYEDAGIDKKQVLIKLASTWEGFEAAKELKKEGINCNMTLIFSFCQAVAAAEAGVYLISPFVGRIRDWYAKHPEAVPEGDDIMVASQDPGCKSVKEIYAYYKKHGYETVVMGASFRSKEEILELAGCDKLTIAPKFLKALGETEDPITVKLSKEQSHSTAPEKIHLSEAEFRFMLNEDAMGTEKLAEGIRNFSKDIVKLEETLKELISAEKTNGK